KVLSGAGADPARLFTAAVDNNDGSSGEAIGLKFSQNVPYVHQWDENNTTDDFDVTETDANTGGYTVVGTFVGTGDVACPAIPASGTAGWVTSTPDNAETGLSDIGNGDTRTVCFWNSKNPSDPPTYNKTAESSQTSDPAAVKWTVTVSNPANGANPASVHVRDAGVAVVSGPTLSPGASCTAGELLTDPNGVHCSLPAGGSVSWVVRPLSTPTRTCDPQSFNNTAQYDDGATAPSWHDFSGPTITLTGDSSLCNGHIHIHKYLPKDNPSDGWQHQGGSSWKFNIDGTGANDYSASNNEEKSVSFDTYAVTEDMLNSPAGYGLIDIYVPAGGNDPGNDQCKSPRDEGQRSLSASVTVNSTGTVHVCAFDKPTTIIVRKVTDPGSSTGPFHFTGLGGSGGFDLAGDGSSQSFPVAPGIYGIDEDPPAGWVLDDVTYSGSCGQQNGTFALVAENPELSRAHSDLGADALVQVSAGDSCEVTFHNRQLARIIVEKIDLTEESPARTWHFDVTQQSPIAINGSGTQSLYVAPGAYDATEQEFIETCDGYTSTRAVYLGGTRVTTGGPYQVGAGEELQFVFVNAPCEVASTAGLIVRKITTDGQPAPANFTGTVSPLNPGAWSLNHNGLATFLGIEPGAYTVSENAAAGYNLLGYKKVKLASLTAPAVCPAVGAPYDATGAVNVGAEETWLVCVYNQGFRTVRLIKVTSGGGLPQTFSGTLTGVNPGTWSGLEGGEAPGGPYMDITGVLNGTQTVAENTPGAPWSLEGYFVRAGLFANCNGFPLDLNGGLATATIPAQGDVTVCIRNTYASPPGKITVIKHAIGGSASDSFGYGSDIPGHTSFSLKGKKGSGDDSVVFSGVAAGRYFIDESPAANWVLDNVAYSGACGAQAEGSRLLSDNPELVRALQFILHDAEVLVAAGAECTVTFTNRALGNLVIIKVDNTLTGDLTRPVGGWDFTVGGPSPATPHIGFGGGSVTLSGIELGTYTVSENAAQAQGSCPALPNSSSQGYYTTVENATAVLAGAGQTITWTFTNRPCPAVHAAPNLQVKKVIDFNGNGQQDAGDYLENGWAMTVTCGASQLGPVNTGAGGNATGTAEFLGTPTGSCTVTEAVQAGYSGTVRWSRTDSNVNSSGTGASVTVTQDENDSNVVTFYNQPLGRLIIKKVNDGGAPGESFTADITSGAQDIAFSATSPSAAQSLASGTYTVSEDAKSGYTYKGWSVGAGDVSCPGTPANSSTAASATVNNGQTTTLCFYNQKPGPGPSPTPTQPVIPTCTSCIGESTPTPVPPATITVPPAATPRVVETVAGERTPGPGALSTPIAPSTGT
ncbi:MAG: hypothetical protein HY814_12325, partial [Candidatus Riflebacteria bacterium]|nr:hypothetical protein [Candidatus Riflebacteria bacterium]